MVPSRRARVGPETRAAHLVAALTGSGKLRRACPGAFPERRMTAPAPARWRVDLSLVLVTLIWGATFVLVKRAGADVSWLLFVGLRFAIAAVVLAIAFRRQFRAGTPVLPSLRAGAIAGCFLFTGYILQTFGLKYTSAANAGFITGLYIPLVPLLGALVFRKPPKFSEGLGVVTAFAGMALMTVKGSLFDINHGDLLVVACSVVYAGHILVLGHFAATSNVQLLAFSQIATGAVIGAVSCWWVEPPRIEWTAPVGVALVVTSLFATALAFLIQTWAQKYTSPTRTAIIFSLEPVFAWIAAWLLAGEVLSARAVAGALLILARRLFVDRRPTRSGDGGQLTRDRCHTCS